MPERILFSDDKNNRGYAVLGNNKAKKDYLCWKCKKSICKGEHYYKIYCPETNSNQKICIRCFNKSKYASLSFQGLFVKDFNKKRFTQIKD